ncbi:MAG: cell division protein FtsA [Flavobacteriaceae bacterium]|nr:cell division protein FtsA [Flavobacteriaceae bacterium]
MDTNNRIIVGLDIGTTKVCAIVGQLSENGKINVLGIGKSPSQGGVSRGMVANVAKAVTAIQSAVEEAIKQSEVDIKTVFVGIAGHHIKSLQHRGTLSRKQWDIEITEDELNKLEEEMENLALSPGLEIIHVLPQEYRIDGEDGIKDPIGRVGVRVECNYHIITGETSAAKTILMAVRRAGLEVADLIVEPVASAAAVLSDPEMEAGVALVDIGGGTTDICIFDDGSIRHTAIIPIGGDRITKDLQEAFGILKDQAEYVKTHYGSCYPTETMKNEVVVVPGLPGRNPKEISLFAISQVIQARMEDIIQKVDFEIVVSGIRNKLAGGLVLTGGGSGMKDITQLFHYFIGLEIHIGSPGQRLGKGFIDEVRNPMYATSIGLVIKGFELAQKNDALAGNNQRMSKQDTIATGEFFTETEIEMETIPGYIPTPQTIKSNPRIFKGGWDLFKNWMADGEDFKEDKVS